MPSKALTWYIQFKLRPTASFGYCQGLGRVDARQTCGMIDFVGVHASARDPNSATANAGSEAELAGIVALFASQERRLAAVSA
eukprot:scaffold207413_cov18-Prasinocladus_malaysianus.AAC.1